MTSDASELRTFARDLERSAAGIAPQVRAVVSKGALNVKKDISSALEASPSFAFLAPSVTYDLEESEDSIAAEIGPVKRGRGSARTQEHKGANIAFFGGSRGGGIGDKPTEAYEAEVPRLEKALGDILGDIL